MISDPLEGLTVFMAVAQAKSLREAGDQLGVSGSAVGQALRRLEDQLGVVLVQRTTRSARLTEAGQRLFDAVGPALNEVRTAVAEAGEGSGEPRGTLRVVLSPGAEHFLRDEVVAGFLAEHPHVQLDLAVSNEITDIVAEGYDAGIHLGEVIDRDMIAVPISGDLRLVVVGAPSYFARRPMPAHPRELIDHECINWHSTPSSPPYRWEFSEKGRDFSVAVPMRALTTDPALIVRLARAGAGLAMVYDGQVRDDIARGTLVPVLEKFSTPFPGFYLYYPQRRHVPPALRALVDYLRPSRAETRGNAGRPASATDRVRKQSERDQPACNGEHGRKLTRRSKR
jgi:DNA-binding transcriptional LysR family regulator